MIINIKNIDISYLEYSDLLKLIINPKLKTVSCINQYYFNLLYGSKDYSSYLKNFELVHPDGIGMKFLAIILKKRNVPNITGSDLYLKILDYINSSKKTIFLFGDKETVLLNALNKIKEKYPNIVTNGFLDGYRNLDDEKIIKKINSTKSEFLFVGLGALRQEKWIAENYDKLNCEKIIAIGGWFRILAGDRKRGPKFVRDIGFEWLVRLITEPKYVWKRYLIGIPLFIYRIIILKYKIFKDLPHE